MANGFLDRFARSNPSVADIAGPDSLLSREPGRISLRGTSAGIGVVRGGLGTAGEEIGFQPAGGRLGPARVPVAPTPIAPVPRELTEREGAQQAVDKIRSAHDDKVSHSKRIIAHALRKGLPWEEVEDFLKAKGYDKLDAGPKIPKELEAILGRPSIERIEEVEEVKAEAKPTFASVEGRAFDKWSTGARLSKREQELVDNRLDKEGAKDPALVSTIKFLAKEGIATDTREAFSMAKELGTKSREQAILDVRLNLEKPDSLGEFLEAAEVDERTDAFIEWYDTQFRLPKTAIETDMPSASEHKGRTVRDSETGQRFKSDGKTWVEIE